MLPWRVRPTPYHVLVSELMLQQTQVERVISKYLAFIEKFPTVESLSAASQKEVLLLWQGLGYNRRALFLHRAAQEVVRRGGFPDTRDELMSLPGIGPYTAGAIRSFAYNQPECFLETNVRTVLIHHFFPRSRGITDAQLMTVLTQCMTYVQSPRVWYSALMDYGTYLKRTFGNASRKSATYSKQSAFQGSRRQIRGAILRALSRTDATESALLSEHPFHEATVVTSVIGDLLTEGFIVKKKEKYSLR